jgi:hypothetical protein
MDTLGAYGIVNPKPDKPFRIAFSEQFHSWLPCNQHPVAANLACLVPACPA